MSELEDPLSTNPPDDPNLPRVLLLGDSISLGYTPEVQRRLAGLANAHRISGTVEATVRGGLVLDTRNALLQLNTWLGTGRWDVIHFNWGLHDAKITASGEHQVPLPEYEKNLEALVVRLKQTQAHLIWASTTLIPPGNLSPHRIQGDEEKYNSVAQEIMEKSGIPIDDLFSLSQELQQSQLQKPANVHFTDEGSARLGEQVVRSLRQELEKGK
jgi:lysophospholipase L1-like esterase